MAIFRKMNLETGKFHEVTKKIGEAPQFVKKLNPKMAFFRKMNLEIGKFHQKQHIFTHITSKNMF